MFNNQTYVSYFCLMQSQRDPRLNEILFPLFDHKRVKNIIDTYEVNREFCTAGHMIL